MVEGSGGGGYFGGNDSGNDGGGGGTGDDSSGNIGINDHMRDCPPEGCEDAETACNENPLTSWADGDCNCVDGYVIGEDGNCIINQLADPCLFSVADQVLSPDLDDAFNNIIQEAFNTSDDVNLIVRDDFTFTNTAIGKAVINESLGVINVDIYLNADRLPNTTKELIAATIYHEAFHALILYFDSNKDYQSSPTEHHINLFNNYLHALQSSMSSAFPSLSNRDALGLILKGMLAYDEWGGMYNEILARNNFTTEELESLRDAYRDGTLGTPCN